MRKLFTFLVPLAFSVLLTAGVFAQSPEKMSYQAVIRNSSDAIVVNTLVGMQISILQGSAGGTAVYAETQTPTTNENGLVSIEIGNGTVVSGNFAAIDWANGPYFIKTETDPKGGINYTITGTSQLLTVPYALYAKTAETLKGGIIETDPTFTKSPSANITATEITKLNNLSGINTGDQDLSALATKTALGDSMEQVRGEIPDVSGFLTSYTETDPTFTKSPSANITATEITKLNNLSGINTGDQDLSGLATTTAVTADLSAKVDKVAGKGLSTNDYTTPEKTKLAGIATNAEENVQADWNQITNTADDYIKNKPTIPTAADGSETKVTAGTNVTVTGAGTTASPYLVNAGGDAFWEKSGDDIFYHKGKILTSDIQLNNNSKIIFDDNGQIGSQDDRHSIHFRRKDNIMELREYGDIVFSPGAKIPNEPTKKMILKENGNLQLQAGAELFFKDNGQIRSLDENHEILFRREENILELREYGDIVFTSGARGGIEQGTMIVHENGNVGIGTGTREPESKLTVDGKITCEELEVNGLVIPIAVDGSETKVTAGTNVTVTGAGTSGSPYVINTTVATTLTIGQSYQGGKIFWLDASGQHGLIASTSNLGEGLHWYNGIYRYTGASGDGLYAGAMNTAIIVATQMADNQTGNFAAKVCADYSVTDGGVTYGDWYLPSRYELNLLLQKKMELGISNCAGWWSSTEYNATDVLNFNYLVGQPDRNNKASGYCSLAVRAF